VLPRIAAKNAVKEELRAQAIRPERVKPAEIAERAKAYLEAHPELFEEAYSRAWRLGLVDHVERIEAAVFDDEKRKSELMPDWRRSAVFKTLKPI